MDIEFDEQKRRRVLLERGLDFVDAAVVFDHPNITIDDDRVDYNEHRHITFGKLGGRLVVVVWTERNGKRRIISLRKANTREVNRYAKA